MKKNIVFLFLCITAVTFAQRGDIPSVSIKTLDGKSVLSSELVKPGEVTVISFWSTSCKPCLQELEAISNVYDEWKEEANFNFIAISVDDSRSSSRVKSLVAGKGWPFSFYLDTNQDLKRALNVTIIPHTVVVDKTGKIVYSHVSYTQGSEVTLFNEVKKAVSK